MFGGIAKNLFGSSNDRYVKSLDKIVRTINALEPQLEALSDEELAGQTDKFRDQLANGKSLDSILPEAFDNYLLRLGWGHGDDEIISRAQADSRK